MTPAPTRRTRGLMKHLRNRNSFARSSRVTGVSETDTTPATAIARCPLVMWRQAKPCYLPGHKGGDMTKTKSIYGRGSGKRHPVDIHVGARARMRRTLLGMTQTDLGDSLGLTFQQVQKYESGVNRIGAGRLCDLARVLDMPIEYFFAGMPPEVAVGAPATKRRAKAKQRPGHEPDPMAKRETLELVRAYYEIEDVDVRQRVYQLTKAIGAAGV